MKIQNKHIVQYSITVYTRNQQSQGICLYDFIHFYLHEPIIKAPFITFSKHTRFIDILNVLFTILCSNTACLFRQFKGTNTINGIQNNPLSPKGFMRLNIQNDKALLTLLVGIYLTQLLNESSQGLLRPYESVQLSPNCTQQSYLYIYIMPIRSLRQGAIVMYPMLRTVLSSPQGSLQKSTVRSPSVFRFEYYKTFRNMQLGQINDRQMIAYT